MNRYLINVNGDQNVEILANTVKIFDNYLQFYRDDILIGSFIKWQYWKLINNEYENEFPKRIKF